MSTQAACLSQSPEGVFVFVGSEGEVVVHYIPIVSIPRGGFCFCRNSEGDGRRSPTEEEVSIPRGGFCFCR